MLALTAQDIRTLVSMPDAIRLVRDAFRELSEGKATSPLRTPVPVPEQEAVSLFMPAAVPSAAGLGLKVVSVFPHNRAHGKPSIYAIVYLVDPADGAPLAIMDGTFLTALRTGAVSGAATNLLARADAHVLTMFGSGAQAYQQVRAVCAVRPIDEVRVISRTTAHAEEFARRLPVEAPDVTALVRVVTDPREAVHDADVICTATPATQPLFSDSDLAPGVHINAVGAYTPAMQEIPVETVARALVVVDERAAAWAEAGDLIIARAQGLFDDARIHAELGELAAGHPGRSDPSQVTLFKSVGNAVQDIAVGRFAVDQARARGMGQEIALNE
jgi:ornithine cyclodeaminase